MTVSPIRPIVESIEFTDQDSQSHGGAIVRVVDGFVGLSVFVAEGGECGIYLTVETCNLLTKALERASRLAAQSFDNARP